MDINTKNSSLFRIKFFVPILFLFCVNTFTLNTFIPLIIGTIEIFICLFFLITKNINNYIISLIIFASTSFEMATFVTKDPSIEIYSLINMSSLRGYPFLILCILPLLYTLSSSNRRYDFLKKLKNTYIRSYSLYKIMRLMFILGIMMGILSFIVNDNNIRNLGFAPFLFSFRSIGVFCIISFYVIYQIVENKNFKFKLELVLFNILISIIIASIISIISGQKGDYGLDGIVLMPLTLFFAPMIMLFFLYPEFKQYRLLFLFLSLATLYVQFFHSNAFGGKSWLVMILLILILLISLIKKKKILGIVIIGISLLILFPTLISFLNNSRSGDSQLNNKLNQAVFLISFYEDSWYDLLPASPKYRVDEFLNIVEEYKDKPYFLITGKGFGGSIKDHTNTLGIFNEDAFTDDQYINNSFYALHETINVIFTEFGLFGLLIFLFVMICSLKNYLNNPWIVLGGVWFFFFWGYSFSLGLYGISCLILGFYKLDIKSE